MRELSITCSSHNNNVNPPSRGPRLDGEISPVLLLCHRVGPRRPTGARPYRTYMVPWLLGLATDSTPPICSLLVSCETWTGPFEYFRARRGPQTGRAGHPCLWHRVHHTEGLPRSRKRRASHHKRAAIVMDCASGPCGTRYQGHLISTR